MATVGSIPIDSPELLSGQQSGHWFPALRPDATENVQDNFQSADSFAVPLPSSVNGDVVMSTKRLHPPRELPEKNNEQSSVELGAAGAREVSLNSRETPMPLGGEPAWSSQPLTYTAAGDELPSDDDDERLDPAWGIKRIDTTQIRQTVNRSTTFPDFGSTDPLSPSTHTISNSDLQWRGDEPDTVPVAEQIQPAVEPQQLAWLEDPSEPVTEAFPWTATPQSGAGDESVARYDEGLLLIQPESKTELLQAEQMQEGRGGVPAADNPREAGSFPNLVPPNATPSRPVQLDRKSTAQVLTTLDFAKRDKLDSPVTAQQNDASFFDDLGNEPSADNIIAQSADIEDVDAMWKAALDDDEFLVEDADDLLPDSEPGSPSSFIASLQAGPTSELSDQTHNALDTDLVQKSPPQRQYSASSYAPHQPTTSDLLQLSPASTMHNTMGLSRPGLPQHPLFDSHSQPRPAAPQQMQSFVDQAKDGYKSPYDLPMDITKSRKRVHAPQPVQTKSIPPPPRSSSLSDKPLQSPFNPVQQAPPSFERSSASSTAASMAPRSVSAFSPPVRPESQKSNAPSSFFEELPAVSRAKPSSSHGRYTPQQNIASPPQLPPQSPPNRMGTIQEPPSPPRQSDPYAQYQLRPPERLDPYANTALQPPAPAPSVTNARYSPAPVAGQTAARSGPSPRYSPAPPPQPASANSGNRYASQQTPPAQTQTAPPLVNRYASQPAPSGLPSSNILPFQPRTSSPLAIHKRSSDAGPGLVSDHVSLGARPAASSRQVSHSGNFLPRANSSSPDGNLNSSVPLASPPKRPVAENLPPPRRSQTQSPSKQRPQPSLHNLNSDLLNRPASAYGQSSPGNVFAQPESFSSTRPQLHARGLASELEFVRPTDDTQFDPLERWKGAPLFTFGFGGSIVSSFPKHVPRYTAGAVRPQIKSASGEVSIRDAKDLVPKNELISTFPGPLRTKAKKKDVLSWLTSYISALESQPGFVPQSDVNAIGRHHEKILLWKIVRVLVEHDGSLDGPALPSVNLVLSPEVHALDESTASQYRSDEHLTGIYRPSGGSSRTDSSDPLAVETLRKRLVSGDRQSAVIHAMDNRLWSHALIIASTMERSMWSQVVREFVRQEVKTVGNNAEPLSALYEIFGGNLEECIDELVPPSARAGLRMVSKLESAGPAKNALDGLNRWKETLSLVLNNRSPGDFQALAILGKLLEDYQRIDAAHICYLFSRNPAKTVILGGVDDEQTPIILLGADHRGQPFDFTRNEEAVLLSEVYEFAIGVLAAQSQSPNLPHLAVFKLHKAAQLAENGMKSEAQAYCEAIASTFKSSTKLSPYYHPLLLSELDDLSSRLKQTPIQGSSSWIGKPSLEKVSGSVWNKFTTFVAGDDSDAESKGSAKDGTDAGPFANVSGTPSLSRSGSQTDLYGSYPLTTPPVVSNTIAGSRYAPNGLNSARSSSELTRGRPSLDSQRSPPAASYAPSSRPHESVNMHQQHNSPQPFNPYQAIAAASAPTSYPQSPPRRSYMPNSISQSIQATAPPVYQGSYSQTPPAEEVVAHSYGYAAGLSSDLSQPHQDASAYGHDEKAEEGQDIASLQPEDTETVYEAPPTSYGYEPPSENGYAPYVPEPDSPDEARPKKKSFMDDDDDFGDFPQAGSHPPPPDNKPSPDNDAAARKRNNDAAADAAFRAAAEADANREKEKVQSKRSSSWFGGWLGSKKAPDGLDSNSSSKSADTKVYRANLGESKMKLYYDKDLGKWVNPDNPDAGAKTATPPPPRMGGTPAPSGGPPRSSVASHGTSSSLPNVSMGPPSVPGSRAGTPAGGPGLTLPHPPNSAGLSGPPSAASTPPIGITPIPHAGHAPAPGLGSRPGTAMSNASSIDDLIGPAGGRKGAKGAKKAKGRYVDVMAK